MKAGDLLTISPLDRAHAGAGGRDARRRLLALPRSRARAHPRRAGRDLRHALRLRVPHRPRRHAARHHGRLRALLHRPAHGGHGGRRHPLVELPQAAARAPRGVLRAAAHGHARRSRPRGQHAFRLVLPRIGDPERLAVRAHRLPRPPGGRRRGGGQVPGARRRHLGVPHLRHGAGLRRGGDDVGRRRGGAGRRRPRLAGSSWSPSASSWSSSASASSSPSCRSTCGRRTCTRARRRPSPPTSRRSPRAPSSPCSCATCCR